jgi:hypothetical protein
MGNTLVVPMEPSAAPKEKKGGSERKKKLAFRKTAIFGKEGKENSKHKKTHSIGGNRSGSIGSGSDAPQVAMTNSGGHIPVRTEELDSDGSDIMPALPKSILGTPPRRHLAGAREC